nr:hypothetical protein [Tanacetum cinerariifolium]
METKKTLSLCSDLDEQEIQQLQKQVKILKENSLNKFNALKTTTQRLERKTFTYGSLFQQAFAHLFHTDVRTFKYELSQNTNNLENKLNKEILHEKDSKSALSVIKVQFDKFIHFDVLKPFDPYSSFAAYDREVRKNFKEYTQMEAQTLKETIIQNMNSAKIVSNKRNDPGSENQSNTSRYESSMSRNECNDKSTYGDDTNIYPSYDTEPMVKIPYTAEYNVFTVDTQNSKQPKCINNTCVVEKVDRNVIPDSLDMCDNETSRTLGESNSIRDSCLIKLQIKQTEFERYKAFNDHTVNYDKLKSKLNETLGLLAKKEIDIKEGLKLKAYEISVVKEKNDELVKQSLLTKSHYEGLVKMKTKVILDLKLKEEKDIDKMISMEKQLKFLNEIVYKRNHSIQTIHMLAPKGPTFNGRPIFENPIELVDQAWEMHSHNHFHAPTAIDMEVLIKTCLMPLAIKTQNDSFTFVHELKQEMYANLKYVESLENEIDELKFDKTEFPNKSSNVYMKTMPPRSGLTWKPTGRIFTQVGLKWIPIRKLVETRHNTNDSASPLGKKTHNPNTTICVNSSSFSVESDSLPQAHAQTIKTYYKHQDSRIKKAQVLKTKTFANSDIKDPSSETKLQGRFLASFQDDTKMELYMMNRQHGRMILESFENGPLIWPTIEENGMTRPRKYYELTPAEAIQVDCDIKATNIILQYFPPEERECKLYDEFDKFAYRKGEILRDFYLRFSLLLNDMNIYNVKLEQFQQGEDPISAINYMMSFLPSVVTSRYPTTNNQLRNSSNPRQQATINDGRVMLQPVQGRQISFATGTTRNYIPGASRSNFRKQMTVICYNCKGEGHMSKQCTKVKRKQDDSWFKDKVLMIQAQANGQILREEELAFLANPGTAKGQATQIMFSVRYMVLSIIREYKPTRVVPPIEAAL